MELFWELASTIALSLLLPLIFIKILSVPPNLQKNEKESVVECDRDHNHDHGVKSDSQKWETGIVRKFDEFRNESVPGKLVVREIVDASCGSTEILATEKIDDNRVHGEIAVADLAENPVEEASGDCAVEEQESNEEIKINEVGGESRTQKVEEAEISRFVENRDEIDDSTRKEEEEEEIGENNGLLLDEEDWEGIERTELEKRFGDAVVFVGSKINVEAGLSNDVKMKLYGYHRIATQGPCQEPQPMPLKFSARAKWNAWQQLGIMSPEMAMEQYINLLSENIPHWVADSPDENAKSDSSADIHAFAKLTS